MRTDKPLLVSIPEASFQLSIPQEEILTLIRDGELIAVKISNQVLVMYESLTAFTRRARRNSTAVDVAHALNASARVPRRRWRSWDQSRWRAGERAQRQPSRLKRKPASPGCRLSRL